MMYYTPTYSPKPSARRLTPKLLFYLALGWTVAAAPNSACSNGNFGHSPSWHQGYDDMASTTQHFTQEHGSPPTQSPESIVTLCRGFLGNMVRSGDAPPNLNSRDYVDGCIAAGREKSTLVPNQ